MSWDSYEKGPFQIFIKVIGLLIVMGAILGVVGYAFNWCGDAAQVTRDEFGPKAMIQKYEWFKEQSAAIKKMDQDIVLFEKRSVSVVSQYKDYGQDKTKWPMDIRLQYNRAKEQARDDLMAVVSQRNNLVKEYNAAGSKFNWKPFATDPSAPQAVFEEYSATKD
jgi:hypothetical protein